MVETRAVAKYLRVSPTKARIVMDLVRGKDVKEAQAILKFTPNAAAALISKVVKSAAANATNNFDANGDRLYINRAFVDQGPTMKRVQPRAQGRAYRILKRSSHITVFVAEREGAVRTRGGK